MAEDPQELPHFENAGFQTLAAMSTRRSVDKIVKILRRERQRGVADDVLRRAMGTQLSDYDEQSRDLMFRLAAGGEIADDFPPQILKATERPKTGTMALTLSALPPKIGLHSLVHHRGEDWMVSELSGLRVVLKLLM